MRRKKREAARVQQRVAGSLTQSELTFLAGQFSVSPAGASGVFQTITGANFALTGGIGSLGSCWVTNNPAPVSASQGVDVGNVTATDSAGSFPFALDATGVYRSPAQFSIPVGAAFSLQGSGNASVGSFATNLTLPATLLAWTNQNSSVHLSSDFNITWSGAAPGTVMQISSIVGSAPRVVEFTCYASADAGQFTVPVSILSALPPFSGALTLQNLAYVPFSASGLGTGFTVLSISQVHSTVSCY